MFHLLQKLAELIEKKKLQDGLLSVVRTRHALAKWFVFYTEQTVVVLVRCVNLPWFNLTDQDSVPDPPASGSD